MKKIKLLLEGGVAGHLSHLYDNRELTFNEIKSILRKANAGKLTGTEKTDGYNIYLGSRQGIALYARNKGDMVAGGRTLRDLKMREFAGGDQVRDVYLNSFRAFQKAIDSMSPEEHMAVFGREGEIFYNTEIQGPGASNVVNYDANVLSIHHGGHKKYVRDTNSVEVVDTEDNDKVLNSLIDRFEQATTKEPFSVRRTAVMQLSGISDDRFFDEAIEKLEGAGFSGNMTIGQYLEERLTGMMRRELSYFSPSIQDQVVDYILGKRDTAGKKTANLRTMLKGLSDEQKDAIRDIVRAGPKFIKKIIFPIEDAIHDFSVELLKGMESAYILDNAAELQRLRGEVQGAIQQITDYSGPGAEEAHEILKQQLKKLKHHSNINTNVEGFVFQHGDSMYKFTGNFAPVNQLLGLFRYGRGAAPPIMSQGSQKLSEGVQPIDAPSPAELYEVLSEYDSIGVFPGGFKPPHKGHFAAARNMAKKVDFPIIIMGHGGKTNPRTINGEPVDFDVAAKIWEVYANDEGIHLYILETPPGGNPMHIAYDILQNAQPGQTIHMVAGAKDGGRFRGQAEGYRPQGVNLDVEPMPNTVDPDTNKPMSATHFRQWVEQGKDITKFVPKKSVDNIELIANILGGKIDLEDEDSAENNLQPDMLFDLIQEMMGGRAAGRKAGGDNPIKAWPEIQQGVMDRLGALEQIPAMVGDGIMAGAERTADETVGTLAPLVGGIPQEVGGMMANFGDQLEKYTQDEEKKEKMASLQQQQSQIAEISAAGGGGLQGAPSKRDCDPDNEDCDDPTIFREDMIEEILNYFTKTGPQ